MIKINYPDSISKRRDFENNYSNSILKSINITSLNRKLNKIKFRGAPLNIELIIKSHFADLIEITKIVDDYLSTKTKTINRNFKKLFDYKTNQSRISFFFMQQKFFNISSCYYCNIDYVNAFKDISDYEDALDFVNNANIDELKLIKGIGEKNTQKIVDLRRSHQIKNIKDLKFTPSTTDNLTNFNIQNSSNHFTIDHFLPQAEYPYLSLSLYNFVPSCYACNSKFKKALVIGNIDDLKYISPSSDEYSLPEDLEFQIIYKKDLKDVKSKSEFIMKGIVNSNKDIVEAYLKVFKIRGRYLFHKNEITNLITRWVQLF